MKIMPPPQHIIDQWAKESLLKEAREYLNSTDWIVSKISEAMINGEDTTTMKTEYAEVLTERQAKRDLINASE